MTRLHFLVLLVTAGLLAGCATPLNIPHDGEVVASAAGLRVDELRFISYCSYAEGPYQSGTLEFSRGVIAVSPYSIHLLEGNLPHLKQKPNLVIPFRAMDRVALRPFGMSRQLQISRGNRVVVVEISKNRDSIDREGSELVFKIIANNGVTKWEGGRHYWDKMSTDFYVPVGIYSTPTAVAHSP